MHHTPSTLRHQAAISLVAVLALVASGCSGDDSAGPDGDAATDTSTTTALATAAPEELPADTVAAVQGLLDASLEPGAIAWDCCGVDAPATGVAVAVRAPGRTDLLLGSGVEVDGDTFSPDASFNAATLTVNMVQTLGWQLVDEGELDPAATVESWAPGLPDADEVTVEMLLEATHGWGDYGEQDTLNITADFERSWTLPEVLATLEGEPRVGPPGTFDADTNNIGTVVLAHGMEQVTGRSLAELVEEKISAPLELDQTFLSDGTDLPADFQAGVFTLDNQPFDTSQFPNTSYNTYLGATSSMVTSVGDALDLLDAWMAGSLFTTDRVPTADRFPSDRPLNDGVDISGEGVPLNGYCPCTPEGDGNVPAIIGRTPKGFGTDLHVLAYPDGISVVLHYNSNEEASDLDLRAVAQEIHETVAEAL